MTECAICHGESGEEPSDGFKVCDVCMGKKSLPPGHHLYQEKEEAVEDQAIYAVVEGLRKPPTATCPNCKRELALCADNWYADRTRRNGFKRLCKDCQRARDTAAHARMRAAKEKVLAQAEQIGAWSKPMLPVVPVQSRILVQSDGSEWLDITIDDGIVWASIDNDFNGSRFSLDSEDQIDRLAETLKAILRQVSGGK